MPKKTQYLVNNHGGLYREMPSSFKCPKCHAPLVERLGKYGKFLSCTNYHSTECDGGKFFKRDKDAKHGYSLKTYSELKYMEKKRKERFQKSIKRHDETPTWKKEAFKSTKRTAPKII